ncbi:hypothetical protein DSL72_007888 [Monilinia vaccinii-corymbosi]|uniref:Uncharacterized protein n=1 Tax=Monilinia vaccinii-corymbosi TaxID=61207 RepID=A0A8A3PJB3_9HELO|nr:hypothetical protein DSL72_007888 [Monilinia vaccinii-corymbosi]
MAPPTSTIAPGDEITSRAETVELIPPNQLVSFRPESGSLVVKVDFYSPGPSPEPDSVDHLLGMINTLPQYAFEARVVHLGIIFKYRRKDDLGFNQARHLVISRLVEEINEFQNITSLRVSVVVGRIHLDQILDPVSAVYGLRVPFNARGSNFRGWILGVKEDGKMVELIRQGSPLDHILLVRFVRGH